MLGPLASAIISSTFLVFGIALIISGIIRGRKTSGRSAMASLSFFILIGALIGGVSGGIAWAVVQNTIKPVEKSFEKKEQQPAPIEQKSSGPNSPNIIGSGNTVIIHPEPSKAERKPKSASTMSPEESMQIGAAPGTADYVQKYAGIEWKPEYSELQINFSNPTSRDFVNLDLTILPNLMIAATGEVTNFGAQFIAGGSNVPLPTDINQQLAERRSKGENFKVVLPLSLSNATRFRCATLPRHSILVLILALVNEQAAQDGIQVAFSAMPPGLKALPKHLTVKGSYQDGEQSYEVSKEFKF